MAEEPKKTELGPLASIEHAEAVIVVVAQVLNPSIFTETWLVKHDIVSADAFVGLRVFSAEMAQFQTKESQVLVIPARLQITVDLTKSDVDFAFPLKIALRSIQLLPQTPYQALGMNFNYFVTPPAGEDLPSYSRNLFGDGTGPLIRAFASKDAKFGRYFSQDYESGRLKLDIKPVIAGPEHKDLLQFAFNFHYELSKVNEADRPATLVRLLGTWESMRQHSLQLVELGLKSKNRG
jgi:hypothetical protein